MTSLLHAMAAATAYSLLGAALLVLGFLLTDALTPAALRSKIWVERNQNAAIFLSSKLIGVGAIAFTSIMTTYEDLVQGLVSTAVFGLLGLALMAGAFWLVDVLTPGPLGEILTDATPQPAVWVTAATNVSVAAIVCASII